LRAPIFRLRLPILHLSSVPIVPHELEIIGPASSWLSQRVQAFCKSLAGTAWGDVPPARLVVAQDLAVALHQYLPADRYRAWERRQRDRGGKATGVGMGFVASDGVPTAVAFALRERADLLAVCCHELCELSIAATGGNDRETMDAAMSGVIWSEHVVERRRAEVFKSERWPRSVMDQSFLTRLWNDYQAAFPALIRWAIRNDAVPDEMYGHWQIITRELVCAYGRAQGGNLDEEREIEAFLGLQVDDLSQAWLDLMIMCDRAFASPHLIRDDLDTIGQDGWHRVYEALRHCWNHAYVAAQ
jgi:hypothetical protein